MEEREVAREERRERRARIREGAAIAKRKSGETKPGLRRGQVYGKEVAGSEQSSAGGGEGGTSRDGLVCGDLRERVRTMLGAAAGRAGVQGDSRDEWRRMLSSREGRGYLGGGRGPEGGVGQGTQDEGVRRVGGEHHVLESLGP